MTVFKAYPKLYQSEREFATKSEDLVVRASTKVVGQGLPNVTKGCARA